MPKTVAFLRAINVGGRNVKMAELRQIFEDLGFRGVSTFIASGNVIFDSAGDAGAGLEDKIEKGLREALGYEVATFLRTEEEVRAIAGYKSFSAQELAEAQALSVGLLKGPLDSGQRAALAAMANEIDDFHLHGREVYWRCRVKQSESKFSNAAFERALGATSTFRTIRTFERLAAKLPIGG